MKIKIIKDGLFGVNGAIRVGTELDVDAEPKAWAGRYVVVSETKGKTAVTNPKRKAD